MESLGVGDPPPHGVEESETNLPQMMFAEGEEPVGVRVLTYQSSQAINTILNALDEEEIQYIKASSFGKIVEIAENRRSPKDLHGFSCPDS